MVLDALGFQFRSLCVLALQEPVVTTPGWESGLLGQLLAPADVSLQLWWTDSPLCLGLSFAFL